MLEGGDGFEKSPTRSLASYALALPQIEKYAKDKHAEWIAHVEAKVEPSIKISSRTGS